MGLHGTARTFMPIPYLLCKNGIGCLFTMPDGAPSEEYGRVQKAFIAATGKKDDIDWCDMIRLWPHPPQRYLLGRVVGELQRSWV
jgi:hypothetical protein